MRCLWLLAVWVETKGVARGEDGLGEHGADEECLGEACDEHVGGPESRQVAEDPDEQVQGPREEQEHRDAARCDDAPGVRQTEGEERAAREKPTRRGEVAAEAGCVVTADTIEELAEKLGMDPQVLSATVTRYNELCDAGVDEDFGKPAQDLIALTTPPYSAAHFAGHVLCTIDGLQIDPDGRVIDAEKQQPIEGLWAVGNCSGGLFLSCHLGILDQHDIAEL